MSRQSSIEYNARIGIKADDFGFGSSSGSIRGGLGGSFGPGGDGGSGQGGPAEKGGGGKSGGSSIGFIAAYALVLGLSGYVIMTDDSATAGSFSLFAQSDDDENSFRVKSVRAKSQGARFDWSRSGMSELKRWEKSDIDVGKLFSTAGSATTYGQGGGTGGGGFLLPGQLEQILDTAEPTGGSYSTFTGSAVKRVSHSKSVRRAAVRTASATRYASQDGRGASEYQLYSFDTPKPAGVVPLNEKNAAAGSQDNQAAFQVFKGRIADLGGYSGFDWQLDLKVKSAARTKPARLRLSGAFDPANLGTLVSFDWSSERSTYLHQLEPGAHERISMRGRELLGGLSSATSGATFSFSALQETLDVAEKKRNDVYIVRSFDRVKDRYTLAAILVQDRRARSWKVFHLSQPKGSGRIVKSRFEAAG